MQTCSSNPSHTPHHPQIPPTYPANPLSTTLITSKASDTLHASQVEGRSCATRVYLICSARHVVAIIRAVMCRTTRVAAQLKIWLIASSRVVSSINKMLHADVKNLACSNQCRKRNSSQINYWILLHTVDKLSGNFWE